MEFKPFKKIPRLSREIIVTEKIDGTNASVCLIAGDAYAAGALATAHHPEEGVLHMWVGSRTRWITPWKEDNHGFAAWAYEHADELVLLGPGHHFGEWWGGSIQRGYGLKEKRFSLFNVERWQDPRLQAAGELMPLKGQAWVPACCHVVPVLYRGHFSTDNVLCVLAELKGAGSAAAPGFMDPEGVVVFHTASGHLYKKTIKGDEEGKHAEAHPPKPKVLRPPRDPSKGGRRIEQVEIGFTDRRKPK